jgi:hypothetical protein
LVNWSITTSMVAINSHIPNEFFCLRSNMRCV